MGRGFPPLLCVSAQPQSHQLWAGEQEERRWGRVSHTKEYWLFMALGWPPSSPSPPSGNCWSCTIRVTPGAPADPAPPWASVPGATASSNSTMGTSSTTGTSSSWIPPLPAFSFSCLSLAAAAAAAATSGAPDASSAPGCGGSVHEGGSGGWGGSWEVLGYTVTRSEGHEGGGGIGVASISLAHPCMAPSLLPAWGGRGGATWGQMGHWGWGKGRDQTGTSDIKGGGRGIRPSTPKKGRPKARL